MTTYQVRLIYWRGYKAPKDKVFLKHDDLFKEVSLPKKFDSLTKARAYAIKMLGEDRRLQTVQISNPKYLDIWQVATCVKRTDDGGYWWYAIRPHDTVGAGHYLNKDGSISKRVYVESYKRW